MIGNPRATPNFLWCPIAHSVQCNRDNTGTQSNKSFPVRGTSCIFIPFTEKDEGPEVTDGIYRRYRPNVINPIPTDYHSLHISHIDQINGVMNTCSVAQHWHCPSQEIKMLYLRCSLAETFLAGHAWLACDFSCHGYPISAKTPRLWSRKTEK